MPSDFFEAMARPTSPHRPDPHFAVALRRRLEEELGMSTTTHSAGPVLATGQIDTIHIRVGDTDRALQFFSLLFGWVGDRYAGEEMGFVSQYIINTRILHVLVDDPAAPPVRLGIHVQDPAATVARVLDLGGRVIRSELQAGGGGWAQCEDDQGVPFGVWRPRDAHPTSSAPVSGEVGYLWMAVPDTARARAFYSELFGWAFAPPAPNDYHHVQNTRIPLGVGHAGTPAVELSFRVDDYLAAAARIRELGGEADEPEESPSGLSGAFRDDQGTAHLNLWQPAAGY